MSTCNTAAAGKPAGGRQQQQGGDTEKAGEAAGVCRQWSVLPACPCQCRPHPHLDEHVVAAAAGGEEDAVDDALLRGAVADGRRLVPALGEVGIGDGVLRVGLQEQEEAADEVNDGEAVGVQWCMRA